MSVVTSLLQETTQYRIGQFIGSNILNRSNGASVDLDMTDTSARPVDIQEGDLIIAIMGRGGTGDNAGSMTSTGYSKIVYQFSNDTYDTNLDVFYKIADGTETNIISASTGQTADSVVFCAMVFRGVKQIKYCLNRNQNNNDDPNINNATDLNYGNICLVIGASAHTVGEAAADFFEQNGDLVEFTTEAENDTNDLTLGVGIRYITNETGFAPGRMDGNLSSGSSISCSAILVLD